MAGFNIQQKMHVRRGHKYTDYTSNYQSFFDIQLVRNIQEKFC